jgi:hypothetical protein
MIITEFRHRMLAPIIAFLGSTVLCLTPRLWFAEWRERDALLREWRDGQGNEPF